MTATDALSAVLERAMSVTRRGALAGTVLAAAACSASAASSPGPGRFRHGVASGDPVPQAVVIWTRIEPTDAGTGRVSVTWEVADDADFSQIVKRGTAAAEPARDWCVKVDVTDLRPGQRYFYRFSQNGETSQIGTTRTAPAAGAQPDSLTLAAVSCSNHPAGFFNVYRAIAQRGDVDLVVHLGDYIYEYGAGGYATQFGQRAGRIPDPPHEILSLDDYRRRYGQYRTDPDLQAAHACAPWLLTWDDHEFSNDAWMAGAENHDPATEGPWTARKAAALQAYYEWMPLRDPVGQAATDIYRAFQWGKLASIAMLDTRVTGRDEVLDASIGAPEIPGDPAAEAAALARFKARIQNPNRQMLGPVQESWLGQTFAQAQQAETTWCILANQVILAKVPSPNLTTALPAEASSRLVEALPQAKAAMRLAEQGLPLNLDAWDGYPAARERMLARAKAAGAKLIALTGDTHSSWANHLRDASGALRGVEFGAPSVTSPDFADLFTSLGLDGSIIAPVIAQAAPDVAWHDQGHRGYVLAQLTPERVEATFITVSTIYAREFAVSPLSRWRWDGSDSGLTRVEI